MGLVAGVATDTLQPNFAFNHLCATVPADAQHDLSCVRAFVNCSEPCKIDSMRRFAERFRSLGVRSEQLQSCYAMAEAVFAVTQSPLGRPPATLRVDRARFATEQKVAPMSRGNGETIELVSVGPALPGFGLRILGQDQRDAAPDQIGEIAIRGPCVFAGYYRSPAASAATFTNGWYRTGDLGFVHNGQLYVTGRSKDVIIAYGKNFYSHDIEAVIDSVLGVKPGRSVAFGVFNDRSGSEDVVVVAESEAHDIAAKRHIVRAVKFSVAGALGVTIANVMLVPPRWLIKTTSGKIARAQNRDKYLRAIRPGSTLIGDA